MEHFRVISDWALDSFRCVIANSGQGEKYRPRIDFSHFLHLNRKFLAAPSPCDSDQNNNGASHQKPNTDLRHFHAPQGHSDMIVSHYRAHNNSEPSLLLQNPDYTNYACQILSLV